MSATTLFESAEQAFFWAISVQKGRNEGQRQRSGLSEKPRPCSVDDYALIVNRLQKNGRLSNIHMGTLRKYGALGRTPDPRDRKEAPAVEVFMEAMGIIKLELERRGWCAR